MELDGERVDNLLTPLRNPKFRRLWISGLFSSLSSQIFPICATLLLLKGDKPALAISLLLSSQVVAYLIFAPFGGLLADRFSRMRLVRVGLFLRVLLAAQLLIGSTPEVTRLTITVFLMGMIDAGTSGAGGALFPDLIDEAGLQAANALRAVTGRVASISGPGIAIFLVSTTSATVGFSVTAIGMLLALLSLARLTVERTQTYERSNFLNELLAGFHFVRKTRWILIVMITLALQTSILFGAEMVLLPIISTREFDSAKIFPFAIMSLSLGSLLTAAFAAKFRSKRPGLVSFVSWFFLVFLIVALIFPISPVFLICCYFIGGMATEPMGVFWQTAIQKAAPDQSRARVLSFESMLSNALMPIGVGLAGPMSHLLGERIYLTICAVIFVLIGAIALMIPGVATFSNPKE
jgi:predicted MFS family arabinose efflux permease